MRSLNTQFLLNLIKFDFLLSFFNIKLYTKFFVYDYSFIIKNFKQFIFIILKFKSYPIYLLCNDKQQSLLFKKYLCNKKYTKKVFLISLKESLTIKTSSIFIVLNGKNTLLLINKILTRSNSIVFSFDSLPQTNFNYSFFVSVVSLKQIIFFICFLRYFLIKNEINKQI